MQDLLGRLNALHRPRLLVRAARIGAVDYCRMRDLPRLLGGRDLPRPAVVALRLMDMEHGLNRRRERGDPGYALTRHVAVLIALVGEAYLMQAQRLQDKKERWPEFQTTAPGFVANA